jgi:hypothetical protein
MLNPFSRRHGLFVIAALLAAEGAVGIVACSSSSATSEDAEAGAEAGVGPDAQKDSPTTPPPPPPDSGKQGNCSAVKGACDIVLQDCPAGPNGAEECIVTSNAGALTTACVPVQPSEQLPQGHACCPSTTANPCLPGLTCVGNDCADGGPQTGRCTPACCKGDDQACGKSDPEGISGACDVTLAIGNTEVYDVCSYRERCKPFGVEPCTGGKGCVVEDTIGTASCTTTFGKALGESCQFLNDCADGLMCIGNADAGTCRMMCLTPGSNHPFDASVEEGGPGAGGCPTPTCAGGPCCSIGVNGLPAWLSFCLLPDGG